MITSVISVGDNVTDTAFWCINVFVAYMQIEQFISIIYYLFYSKWNNLFQLEASENNYVIIFPIQIYGTSDCTFGPCIGDPRNSGYQSLDF